MRIAPTRKRVRLRAATMNGRHQAAALPHFPPPCRPQEELYGQQSDIQSAMALIARRESNRLAGGASAVGSPVRAGGGRVSPGPPSYRRAVSGSPARAAAVPTRGELAAAGEGCHAHWARAGCGGNIRARMWEMSVLGERLRHCQRQGEGSGGCVLRRHHVQRPTPRARCAAALQLQPPPAATP